MNMRGTGFLDRDAARGEQIGVIEAELSRVEVGLHVAMEKQDHLRTAVNAVIESLDSLVARLNEAHDRIDRLETEALGEDAGSLADRISYLGSRVEVLEGEAHESY